MATLVTGILNCLYLIDANSGNLKITLIIFSFWGRKRVWHSNFQGMNELSWLLSYSYKFRKAKSLLNSYSVGMVKYWCSLLRNENLKSAVSQGWIDEWSWVFKYSYIVTKAQIYFNSYWKRMAKYDCAFSRSSGTLISAYLKNKLMNWADLLHSGIA